MDVNRDERLVLDPLKLAQFLRRHLNQRVEDVKKLLVRGLNEKRLDHDIPQNKS